jgi:hypothetical protein
MPRFPKLPRSAIFAAALLAAALAGPAAPRAAPYKIAVLQGLDKVTARVSTIEAPIGTTVRFGTLEVIVRECDKRPPEEPPETAAFVDIWEARSGEAAVSLFRGWMFASSPALSALEHPVYDIWVLDCAGGQLAGDEPPATDTPPADNKLPDLKKLFQKSQ